LYVTPEVDRIAEENRRLKQIVADQALELQLLREIQKKMDARSKSSAR
jgi:predicted transcriptional regulator